MEKTTRKNKDVSAHHAEEPTVATDATGAMQDAKRKPIETLRLEDCSASIWAREYVSKGKPRTFYSVTFERSYKAASGEWRYTKTFDLESLGKLVTLCQQASEAITRMQQNDAAE